MGDGLFGGVLDQRAPMDITPGAYFEEWLPSQVENFNELLETFAGNISFTVSVRVTGEGGGEWTVRLADGKPEFTQGLDPEALVTFIVSEENFIQSVTGQLDDLRSQHRDPPSGVDLSPEAIQKRAKELIEELKNLQGTLHASVDDPERPLAVTVKFSGEMKNSPDCAIKIKKEDVKKMASGELDPQMAFMAGKIQIEGDSSLLLQLIALMM